MVSVWRVATVVLVLFVPLLHARTCNKDPKVNGCSIPVDPKVFYETTFTSACDYHDVCYYCHETFDLDRRFCDEMFHDWMVKACPEGDNFCKFFAVFYYAAVRVFGGIYFYDYSTPLELCSEEWVKDCVKKPS